MYLCIYVYIHIYIKGFGLRVWGLGFILELRVEDNPHLLGNGKIVLPPSHEYAPHYIRV